MPVTTWKIEEQIKKLINIGKCRLQIKSNRIGISTKVGLKYSLFPTKYHPKQIMWLIISQEPAFLKD